MRLFRQLIYALIGMVIIIVVGTVGYQYYENLSLFDALWMTVITLLTVGYGDAIPRTFEGQVFTILIVPFGIGLVTYVLGAFVASMIEGELFRVLGRKHMNRKINRLTQHVIVCGYGRVGQQVVAQLEREGTPCVVIEKDLDELSDDVLYINGDATQDDVLVQAGINRAAGLLLTLPHDADNVFITLTARGLSDDLTIVARTERLETEKKLRRAGADKVINPSNIGGRRMAMSMLKPMSVDYVESILHAKNVSFNIEEVLIDEQASLVGETIRSSRIREKYGVTIVALKRDDEIISNPDPDALLYAGDLLLLFGEEDQVAAFERDAHA